MTTKTQTTPDVDAVAAEEYSTGLKFYKLFPTHMQTAMSASDAFWEGFQEGHKRARDAERVRFRKLLATEPYINSGLRGLLAACDCETCEGEAQEHEEMEREITRGIQHAARRADATWKPIQRIGRCPRCQQVMKVKNNHMVCATPGCEFGGVHIIA